MKPDCPNCQAGNCKHLKNQASNFAAFDELVTMEPQIFKVSAEEYAHLEKLLAEPPKVNERLRRLFSSDKQFTLQQVNDLELSAVEAYKERITIRIMDRVTDLKTCGKNDDCWEFGDLIESYIEEWIND